MSTTDPSPRLESATQAGLDAVEELQSARFGPRHLLLVVAIVLANIFDGYDTLNPSYVISYTAKPWHLSHNAAGFMVSSGLIGFMIGALAHGPIADRIGRRPVLLGALAGSGVLSVLTATAGGSFGSFVTLRLITGLFLGVIMPLGTSYIREFTPARNASKVVLTATSGYCLGGVLSAAIGIYVTPGHGWASLYWIGGLSFVLAVLLIPVLPESVHYLVLAGRQSAVARVLGKLRPDRATAYRGATFIQPRELPSTRESLTEVVSPARWRTSVTLWVLAFLVLFCIYGLSGWLPSVLETRGESFAASFASVAILQCAGIIGGFFVGQMQDRSKSAGIMPRGIVVLMVIATVAVIVDAIGAGSVGDLVFIGVAGFGIVGGQNLLVALSTDTYPTFARSTGTGAMFGIGRVGGILGPYLIGWILDWTSDSTTWVFAVFAIATAGAAIAGAVLIATCRRLPAQ